MKDKTPKNKDTRLNVYKKIERYLISKSAMEFTLNEIAKELGVTEWEIVVALDKINQTKDGVPDLRKLN